MGLLILFIILFGATKGIKKVITQTRLYQLNKINQAIYRDYIEMQRLLLSRHWLGKYGFYEEAAVKKILEEKFILRDKLLISAEKIADKGKVEIKPQLVLMPYFYKEDQKIRLGFLSNACVWIEINEVKKGNLTQKN